MNDELDRLTRALRDTPPRDTAARERDIAAAIAAFDRLKETEAAARQTQDRPQGAGFLRKVATMIDRWTTRRMLAGTASAGVLALALVAVLPQVQTPGTPGLPGDADMAPAGTMAESAAVADAGPAPPATTPLATAPLAAPPAPARAEIAAEAAPAPAPSGVLPMARTGDATEARSAPPPADTEAFASADPNPVKVTAEEPVSTFAVDVDTASYAVVRQSLMAGAMPPRDAVRIEEMVNYFPYDYPPPAGGAPFSTTLSVFPTPWNPETRLVRIGLQGRMPAVGDRPALNLVFLIDTSGSMDEPAKLPLLRQSLALMLGDLRPADEVAIVAYAGSAGLVLPPVSGTDRDAILGALDRLSAGGSTAGAEGLALAYRTAAGMAGDGEVSRIVLATDGDFNLGISDPAALADFVAARREEGVYLSVLGFGRGNLDDAVMQALAQNGNGRAAYVDSLAEARKVLVDQLTGALFPIADDVKVQVEWNPAQVAEYRLIGYETRALARADFNDDRVDAGEIGAGLQVTALYEITAPGSPALRNDPLRYGAAEAANDSPELGILRLRWKDPGADVSQRAEVPILPSDAAPDDDARFAAAIAGFGQLLRGEATGDWTFADAALLAEAARGADPFGYRIEAVNLMRLAGALTR